MTERRHRLNGIAAAGLFVLLWTAPAAGQKAREVEDVFWRDVVCERELEVRAYPETYPDGAYESEARACLEQGLGLTRTERVEVQRGLAEVGQEPGPETKTRQAIRAWQAAKGMAAKGYLSREQADILIVTGQAVEERQRAAAERIAQEEAARQAAAADDAAYAVAEQADTAGAYGEYLETYLAGRHATVARDRQGALERETAARAGGQEEIEVGWGMTVAGISDEHLQRYRLLEDQQGVVVTEVESGGPAETAGIRPGDVIEDVNRQAVNSVGDFTGILDKSGQTDTLLLLVRRGNFMSFFQPRKRN